MGKDGDGRITGKGKREKGNRKRETGKMN